MSGSLGETALLDYFVRVASSVSLPVMIQDAPAYVGVGSARTSSGGSARQRRTSAS